MDVIHPDLLCDLYIYILVFIAETFIGRKFYCLSTSGSPFFPGILEDYACLALEVRQNYIWF